jgi:uncharacterized damage-inducible protein DinB
LLPDRVYSKEELLAYSVHCRLKLLSFVQELSDAQGSERCAFPGKDLSVGELRLYNMRHAQHHAAALNLLLRREMHDAPCWVFSVEPCFNRVQE